MDIMGQLCNHKEEVAELKRKLSQIKFDKERNQILEQEARKAKELEK